MRSSRTGKKVISMAERLRFRPLSILLSTLVWAALWGSLSPMVLVSGVLLSYMVSAAFSLPPMHWEGRFHPIGVIVMLSHLLFDLTISSFRMIRLAFARKVNLNAGIIRVDLASDNDLYQVQVAEMISLVPGTVVIEVVRHPRRLYLHAIDLIGPDPIGRIQRMSHDVESRVLHAFGSKQEIADFEAARQASYGVVEDPELEVEES